MQAIIFMGLQASGKSSFYKSNFFNSHVRISLDLLNTRNKEKQLLDWCLSVHQRLVIDNTNPTKTDRQRYLPKLLEKKYEVIGYYFDSRLEDCLKRNRQRTGKARIPDVGVRATYRKLELPSYDEGFKELYYVRLVDGGFDIIPFGKTGVLE